MGSFKLGSKDTSRGISRITAITLAVFVFPVAKVLLGVGITTEVHRLGCDDIKLRIKKPKIHFDIFQFLFGVAISLPGYDLFPSLYFNKVVGISASSEWTG